MIVSVCMKIPYDIIIPSKHRPNGATFLHLEKEKIPYIVVIEKGDLSEYKSFLQFATFWILPKSNMGIGYSRNFILSQVTKPFVMVDDDIQTLYRRSMKEISLPVFLDAGWKQFKKHIDKNPNIGMFGFKHGTFGIPNVATTSPTTIAHIVFFNMNALNRHNIKYDVSLKAFEDIDIIFKCIDAGLDVCRYNKLIYYTTPSGTASNGGIDYSNNLKQRMLTKMTKKWKGLIEDLHTIRKDNQPAYMIHWDRACKI